YPEASLTPAPLKPASLLARRHPSNCALAGRSRAIRRGGQRGIGQGQGCWGHGARGELPALIATVPESFLPCADETILMNGRGCRLLAHLGRPSGNLERPLIAGKRKCSEQRRTSRQGIHPLDAGD